MTAFLLQEGQSATLLRLPDGKEGCRLRAMGIDVGVRVTCLAFSCLRSAVLLRVNGLRFAVGRSLAEEMEVAP